MPRTRYRFACALALLALLVLLLPPKPTALQTPPPHVAGAPGDPATAPEEDIPAGAHAALAGFLRAYHSAGWTDETADAWVHRATAWTTPAYGKQLEKDYAGGTGGAMWREYREQRIHRSVEINSLALVAHGSGGDAERYVVLADYSWSASAGPVERGRTDELWLVTLVRGAEWQVADREDFSTGRAFTTVVGPRGGPGEDGYLH